MKFQTNRTSTNNFTDMDFKDIKKLTIVIQKIGTHF